MATLSPPQPSPLPDASNPPTSLSPALTPTPTTNSPPPALTPTPAATVPPCSPTPVSRTPPSGAPTGRNKSQRWCRDTPPTGKSGGGDAPQPSFLEALLGGIPARSSPAVSATPPRVREVGLSLARTPRAGIPW
ncbi:hypothetical protein PAHAL_8G124900 [Panicum hallii]|uniref:Uncharacterized protein n=1 Tax=Panicum hallii TaxID=206008 RepID=A0A2T8I8Q6_9POAL|nr:proline-rich receptor-like protein kinase PERK2 [Panicum hallii]PVH34050.1 hypothetical protein PAHAL_8G124900 [Panicum hallii]